MRFIRIRFLEFHRVYMRHYGVTNKDFSKKRHNFLRYSFMLAALSIQKATRATERTLRLQRTDVSKYMKSLKKRKEIMEAIAQ